GVVAAFACVFALSANAEESCAGLFTGYGQAESQPEQGDPLFLSGNQCEAVTKRELRLSLFEIPQEEEDPMSVSVGLKQGGGILRFRIPFSF
ncbi:MAG TPA: hypothetical protein VIY86_03830, partial [Pirellulaceae bacterium]